MAQKDSEALERCHRHQLTPTAAPACSELPRAAGNEAVAPISFPNFDFEDHFGITVEHYRHCRRFCDGQSLHVQREPTTFNKERATGSISIS
jgi:hypothetical protein